MRNLLILLRTCTTIQSASNTNRYINLPKSEVVKVCVSSLINSINRVENHNVELIVLDDHSSSDSVENIKNILSNCKFPVKFIPVLNGTGNGFTMKLVYELVEKHASDLWYHVEDDYLHTEDAINDMIDSYNQFESLTNKMIAINPHDDIWRYTRQVYESFILLGPHRHYRTVKHSTYTCLTSKNLYKKYESIFQELVNLTIKNENWVEDKTINLIWNKPDVLLFSPIPGLAFHMMDESGKDPYINILSLWDSVPHLWKNKEKLNFAIISMYDEKHRDLGELTWPNKKSYAEINGYKAFCKTDNWTLTPIHFEKIKLMLEVMNENPDIDWVWWLDNDAIITNTNIKLESIIDPNYHIIITCDIASINAGSFIVRNSMQGKNWLEFILRKGLEHYKDNRWPEQQPMTDFYISFDDIIKVVPQKTMNSYDYKIYNVDPIDQLGYSGQWDRSDFVLHMPAIPNQIRKQIISKLDI